MVVVEWKIRDYEDPVDEQEAYSKYDETLFSLKIHHGGFFTEPPGRCYTNGTFNHVDFVDADLFSVIELHEMLKTLGYKNKKNKMYYHFKIPNNNLDHGLQALGNDADVMNLLRYIDKYRLIEVFIEHEHTVLETYWKSPQKLRLEEIDDDVESSSLARKPFKKPGLKVNRLPQLLLEGPSLNDDVEDEEDVNEDENGSESNEEVANEDETGSESSESDDSDYIVDEDNVINEVDVDMQEFYQNIDKDVEWVGPSKGNVEVPTQVDVEVGFDLDDFDMDIDCDSDVESSKERKIALRALRKESKNKHSHFYVGQEFADKKEATALVSCQAVETRRQLYVWKNDKRRVRAVCRGKCPNSVGPNASGLNSPNKGKLKQVNGKWVKSKTVETSCSGQEINTVDGIKIKVGGKKGSYVYDTISCPWSLQISKENNTWTVKTYKDEHTCLQTRVVKRLTDKWLSNQIEDIVKPNPGIPIKALKEQLQKKYQVGISTGKVKRARAASIMKVKGDFSEQYSLLRDYVLELQRTNEDTTMKIDLERDYNPSETTRQFKRSYLHNIGRAHCDVLLNNLCEVFNRQLLDGRDVPIITCLEFVREYLMKRIVNVKKVISKSPGPLTPAATKLFEAIKHKATFYTVLWNGRIKYQVSGPYEDQCVVDIKEKNCSCRKWELTGMPCKHAVSVINEITITNADVRVPESWVYSSYWVSTWAKQYSYTINPMNGRNLWSKHPSPYTIIPPKIHPQIGRPPKSRKKSAGEISSQKMSVNGKLSRVGKSVTCGKCGMKGHNRTSCKGIVGGSQASKVGGSQASKVGGSQGSSVGGSKASSVRGSKASSVGVSKRTRGSQTGTSSAAKRSKLF
ncbi:putative RNA-directed DNA polymerase, eukaryota, reverse transcriptase zinc-binding domain protein [Tanacetum coccineum]